MDITSTRKIYKLTRYTKATPLDLLTYLLNTYGKFTIVYLKINEDRMRFQWTPPLLIETLFQQIKDRKGFAKEGGEKISSTHLVQLGYNNLNYTGLLIKYCAKWRKKNCR